MPQIVVIGTSSGGQQALLEILSRLPEDYPHPILIVMHIGRHESLLPQMLQARCTLPVRYAVDNEPLLPPMVLLAPPDQHLLIKDSTVRLSHAAKENFARPAIDPLFRSAAFSYREHAIGIVLTGNLDDGTIGLQAIKACGGITIVQDPAEASASGMPRSALEHVGADYCLPLSGIADKLIELADNGIPRAASVALPAWISLETQINLSERSSMELLDKIGHPSKLTCPECSGALWKIDNPSLLRYRCHTGHSYTAETLDVAQAEQLEEAIWFAIRALHEKRRLLTSMAESARKNNRWRDYF